MKEQRVVMLDLMRVTSAQAMDYIGTKFSEGYLIGQMCAVQHSLTIIFERELPSVARGDNTQPITEISTGKL